MLKKINGSRILTIDPGTNYLGWCIIDISNKSLDFSSKIIDCGIISNNKKGIASICDILDNIEKIIKTYEIEDICCEDYVYIHGKNSGMYVIPNLISNIKVLWYKYNNKEVITIKSVVWKSYICGNPYAQKLDIRNSIERHIRIENIPSLTNLLFGLQDCIDSIAIAVYVDNIINQYYLCSEDNSLI